jgi:hypothetical protein
MGETCWDKDENPAAATVSDQRWKSSMGDVFGGCGNGIWTRVEGKGGRPVEDCQGRKSLNRIRFGDW